MPYRPLVAAMAVLALLPVAACSDKSADTAAAPAERSLLDAIGSTKSLSKFAEALEKTGLAGIFDGPADYTVLAPDDRAFEKLEQANGQLLDSDQAPILAAMLREHILPGTVMPDDIKSSLEKADGKSVTVATMGSDAITFTLENGRIVASGSDGQKAVLADTSVRAANGVVIPVDAFFKNAATPET